MKRSRVWQEDWSWQKQSLIVIMESSLIWIIDIIILILIIAFVYIVFVHFAWYELSYPFGQEAVYLDMSY